MHEDVPKLKYFLGALDEASPFVDAVAIPQDVEEAMRWCAEKSPYQIRREREDMIEWIENEGSDGFTPHQLG